MTYAPATLLAARRYLLDELDMHPGETVGSDLDPAEVGIIGDTAHRGGYHLGWDRIAQGYGWGDYSVCESTRDAHPTNGAAALDIGKFDVTRTARRLTLPHLSRWLVEQCKANTPDTRDIREVIYSPDGRVVERWDRLDKRSTGDLSHLLHTHISYFRDSESRDKAGPFRRYVEGDEDDMPSIRTSLGKTRPQPLVWEQFVPIQWDTEHSDPSGAHRDGPHPGYVPGVAGWVDAQVNLRIQGLRPGDMYQVQYQVHDWTNGRPSTDPWTEIACDQAATAGDQFAIGAISKRLTAAAHLWVAIGVFRTDPAQERALPQTVSGRWTLRQDR